MAVTTHILIAEDDINLGTVLADYLQSKGYVAHHVNNGQEAWELLSKKHYDMLLTDISMPQMNGWQLIKTLRESNHDIPIIITSVKTDRQDIIRGYQLGCDDYMTKPYSMDILICKIEAVLRRYRVHIENTDTEFLLGNMRYDAVRQTLDGKHLSSRENELLLMLCQNMGKTIERSRILTSLWGSDNYFNSRSLSVYVNHLRKLMGKDNIVKIMSVHGKGYKLVLMTEQNE